MSEPMSDARLQEIRRSDEISVEFSTLPSESMSTVEFQRHELLNEVDRLKAENADLFQGLVARVVAEVLAEIGSEQMSQSWDAIGDLLWDHFEPYQEMSPEDQAAWRDAFRAELERGD